MGHRPKNKIDSVVYEISGDSVIMHFQTGTAIIDIMDLPTAMQYRWCLKSNRYIQANGCRIKGLETPPVKLSRLILGLMNPRTYSDHIDRDPTNNQRCNLRAVTPQQNSLNRYHPTTGQKPRVAEKADLHGLLGHRTIRSEDAYTTA